MCGLGMTRAFRNYSAALLLLLAPALTACSATQDVKIDSEACQITTEAADSVITDSKLKVGESLLLGFKKYKCSESTNLVIEPVSSVTGAYRIDKIFVSLGNDQIDWGALNDLAFANKNGLDLEEVTNGEVSVAKNLEVQIFARVTALDSAPYFGAERHALEVRFENSDGALIKAFKPFNDFGMKTN